MKNKKFLSVAIAAILSLGGLAVLKLNAGEARKPFGARGHVLQRIATELELTDDQKAKIKAELASEKDTIVALFSRLHEARKALRETIQSGADETAVRASYTKVAEVEADLAVQRAKMHSRIGPILTEEQLAKVKAFEQRMDEFAINAIRNIGSRFEPK